MAAQSVHGVVLAFAHVSVCCCACLVHALQCVAVQSVLCMVWCMPLHCQSLLWCMLCSLCMLCMIWCMPLHISVSAVVHAVHAVQFVLCACCAWVGTCLCTCKSLLLCMLSGCAVCGCAVCACCAWFVACFCTFQFLLWCMLCMLCSAWLCSLCMLCIAGCMAVGMVSLWGVGFVAVVTTSLLCGKLSYLRQRFCMLVQADRPHAHCSSSAGELRETSPEC